MQGTPWYSILANPKYAFEFNYIGANVTEREKLIEDGKEDEEDDGYWAGEDDEMYGWYLLCCAYSRSIT